MMLLMCAGYTIPDVWEKDFDWSDRLEKPLYCFGYDYIDSDNHYGTAKAVQYTLDNG